MCSPTVVVYHDKHQLLLLYLWFSGTVYIFLCRFYITSGAVIMGYQDVNDPRT